MTETAVLPVLPPDQVASALMKISAARNVQTAWDIFADTLETVGFSRSMYACIGGWHGQADHSDVLLLYRGPTDYADIYLDEQLYLENPIFDWCEQNEGFMSSEDLIAQYENTGKMTPQLARLSELRAHYGTCHGYFGSLRDVVPGVGAVVTMSPTVGVMSRTTLKSIWAAHGDEIQALARVMHLRACTLPHPVRRPLSTRQREVLSWASQGKTVRDIASIMQISVQTVEKHLRLAREALDAANTAHAVRKALQMRLLDTQTVE
ncbi:MAG: LuxR C-terminal-related transcriptional regulator [Pseudomonadota bacterium]